MKFVLNNTKGKNIIDLMRKVGYYHLSKKGNQLSFIRPLERSVYPRFHIYLQEEENNDLIFNLHLDQRKPVYKFSSAHNADYEGEILEREKERIKMILEKEIS